MKIPIRVKNSDSVIIDEIADVCRQGDWLSANSLASRLTPKMASEVRKILKRHINRPESPDCIEDLADLL